MKVLALLFIAFQLLLAADRDGNFEIRCEPTAKVQTNTDVPFEVHVKDGRKQDLPDAKVTVTVAMTDGTHKTPFKATGLTPGLYIAKPNFPLAGAWDVTITVRRDDQVSERTIQVNVVE